MMRVIKFALVLVATISLLSYSLAPATKSFKCMIQLTNYNGEGAYVVVSLMNPKGEYVKTIYIEGDDKEWYHEISSWWKYYGKKRYNVDAISGSTVSPGERKINILKIDSDKVDKGYYLRFESAVEEKNYYEKDIQFELTAGNLIKKHQGSGFIRYVRFIEQ